MPRHAERRPCVVEAGILAEFVSFQPGGEGDVAWILLSYFYVNDPLSRNCWVAILHAKARHSCEEELLVCSLACKGNICFFLFFFLEISILS